MRCLLDDCWFYKSAWKLPEWVKEISCGFCAIIIINRTNFLLTLYACVCSLIYWILLWFLWNHQINHINFLPTLYARVKFVNLHLGKSNKFNQPQKLFRPLLQQICKCFESYSKLKSSMSKAQINSNRSGILHGWQLPCTISYSKGILMMCFLCKNSSSSHWLYILQ